ncbi:MAG: DUF4249 domain-containing protein [Bacteroidota bacterium]|mgnify:CR=1 FL=1
MKPKQTFMIESIKVRWLITFLMLSACVERIEFDVPEAQLLTVVEGMISDNPGPYTVTVSKGISLDADSSYRVPVENASIKLFDDEGNVEEFSEIRPGLYSTGGSMQGQIGHSYYIRIESSEGLVFESEPERINQVGEIENIRFEFEPRTIVESFGEIRADVFNVFVDAKSGSDAGTYVRWKYTGTYKVITYPELHFTNTPPYRPYKDPFPCSGYVIVPGPSGGTLERRADCTCCTCWVNDFEEAPQLSDVQFITANQFKNIKVGEVPINNATFHEKYLVEVEQMSLSRKAFEFFKIVRAQKEGASSIFQPLSGEIKGNIKSINTNESVVGIFWATSSLKKKLYIYPRDVPYLLTPIDFLTLPCYQFYHNASSTKPINWE